MVNYKITLHLFRQLENKQTRRPALVFLYIVARDKKHVDQHYCCSFIL